VELAGLEPATCWDSAARRARIVLISRAFGREVREPGKAKCAGIAGDYWEFAPQNRASGANASPGWQLLQPTAGSVLVALRGHPRPILRVAG